MSHGNGSSAFIFQVTGILKPVTDSTDKMLKLSYSNMADCKPMQLTHQHSLKSGGWLEISIILTKVENQPQLG